MTQQEKLEQLFSEFGIAYAKREAATQAYTSEEGMVNVAPWDVSIDLEEGAGLPGFVATFYFDEDESFLAHRVWKKG